MRYLVCGLNDENYSYPEYLVVDSLAEAKEVAMRWLIEFADGEDYELSELETTDDGYRQTVRFWEYYPVENERFYVTEIKEILAPHSAEMIVYHHAYEGVDFKIEFYGSYNKCQTKLQEIADEYSDDIDRIDNCEVLIDNGNEWEMWTQISTKPRVYSNY